MYILTIWSLVFYYFKIIRRKKIIFISIVNDSIPAFFNT